MPLRTTHLALGLALLASAGLPTAGLARHGADDGPSHRSGSDDSGHHGRGGDDDSSGRGGSDDDDSGRRGGSDDDDSGRGGRDDDSGRRGGDRRRAIVAGQCTDGARAKLKVKRDDGRLEAEFEVDENRAGSTWTVQIRRNGALEVSTRATTGGRSGSFSVERRIADGAGADRVSARATSPSGQVCRAALTY